MARIIIPTTTLVGRKLLLLTQQIIDAQQDATRLQAIVTQIGDGAALEASVEARMPVGSGNSVITGIDQIVTALAGLSTLVSAIDQG